MASISKRTARSWKVSVEPGELERISALKSSGLASQALQALPQRLYRTFSDQRDAEGLAAHYRSLGIEGVTVRRRSTLAWQVRIRIIGAPSLTETFPNKAMAEQWLAAHSEQPLVTPQARELGMPHYTLYLAELVRRAGGRIYFLRELPTLADVYRRIAENLRAQYTLGYYPPELAKPGWRAIRVEVPGRAEVRIPHRAAYYVPASQ